MDKLIISFLKLAKIFLIITTVLSISIFPDLIDFIGSTTCLAIILLFLNYREE
jgi:uncharacterized membrane protein